MCPPSPKPSGITKDTMHWDSVGSSCKAFWYLCFWFVPVVFHVLDDSWGGRWENCMDAMATFSRASIQFGSQEGYGPENNAGWLSDVIMQVMTWEDVIMQAMAWTSGVCGDKDTYNNHLEATSLSSASSQLQLSPGTISQSTFTRHSCQQPLVREERQVQGSALEAGTGGEQSPREELNLWVSWDLSTDGDYSLSRWDGVSCDASVCIQRWKGATLWIEFNEAQ